jgi:hypothetical protein
MLYVTRRMTRTTGSGHYYFGDLPEGDYELLLDREFVSAIHVPADGDPAPFDFIR